MTGLAAKYLGQLGNSGERQVLLSDLSPYAVLIGHNFNFSTKFNDLRDEFELVSKDLSWMYETRHVDGSLRKINYTV